MMHFMRGLLHSKGRISSVRVMSLLCTLTACGIAIYGAVSIDELSGIVSLCAVLLSAAFSGKVAQKFFEKEEKSDEKDKEVL